MAKAAKDTLYIEADEEITAIIDKVEHAKHKVVAIVLPKRATVFQSPVNLKLLKKAATKANKSLVLITSDKSTLAISAVVGVHVAKTLSSKPAIPAAVAIDIEDEVVDSSALEAAAVGAVAGVAGVAVAGAAKSAAKGKDAGITTDTDLDQTIELDNTSETPVEATDEPPKKKLMKIPDFSSFKLRAGLGIFVVALLAALWYWAFVVAPQAIITINTDASSLPVNSEIIATVGAEEVDLEKNVVPATKVHSEKIDSVTVSATGEKNVGEKATGTITLTNCIDDGEKKVIAVGTTFSKGGLSFVTTAQVILEPALVSAGTCKSAEFGLSRDTSLAAAEPGTQYNIAEGSYSSSISGINAYGSDMSGGTSDVVKVISQEDVDKATQQLSGTSKSQALSEMQQELSEKGLRSIDETLGEGKPEVIASPAVGKEAQDVKVTMTVNYNLTGVSDEDLAVVLDSEIQKSLDDTQQNIRDNGLASVIFGLLDTPNDAEQVLSMQTVATIGPDINEEELKQTVIGKKRGEIEKQLESIDGVRSVSVEYSPAWITTTPKSAEKITIVFVEEDNNQ